MYGREFSNGEAVVLVVLVSAILIGGAIGMGAFLHRPSAGFVFLAVETLFIIWCATQPE